MILSTSALGLKGSVMAMEPSKYQNMSIMLDNFIRGLNIKMELKCSKMGICM